MINTGTTVLSLHACVCVCVRVCVCVCMCVCVCACVMIELMDNHDAYIVKLSS